MDPCLPSLRVSQRFLVYQQVLLVLVFLVLLAIQLFLGVLLSLVALVLLSCLLLRPYLSKKNTKTCYKIVYHKYFSE